MVPGCGRRFRHKSNVRFLVNQMAKHSHSPASNHPLIPPRFHQAILHSSKHDSPLWRVRKLMVAREYCTKTFAECGLVGAEVKMRVFVSFAKLMSRRF